MLQFYKLMTFFIDGLSNNNARTIEIPAEKNTGRVKEKKHQLKRIFVSSAIASWRHRYLWSFVVISVIM